MPRGPGAPGGPASPGGPRKGRLASKSRKRLSSDLLNEFFSRDFLQIKPTLLYRIFCSSSRMRGPLSGQLQPTVTTPRLFKGIDFGSILSFKIFLTFKLKLSRPVLLVIPAAIRIQLRYNKISNWISDKLKGCKRKKKFSSIQKPLFYLLPLTKHPNDEENESHYFEKSFCFFSRRLFKQQNRLVNSDL